MNPSRTLRSTRIELPGAGMSRRRFLRASGVALTLPFLESLLPRALAAETPNASPDGVKRFVAIGAPLGFHTPFLFPETAGAAYKPVKYLEPLQDHRDKFTVISGLMHPDVDGGHAAEASFLTGAPHPSAPSFRNTISVDQYAAETIGHLTRYPSLSLSATSGNSLSISRSGVKVPPDSSPSRLYERLFLEGTAKDKERQIKRLQDGRSVMDLVMDDVKQVQRKVGRDDHETLDQYLTSVRDFEQRMVAAEEWTNKPKPKVDTPKPKDIEDRADFVGKMRLMYDLMFLALSTDSTRLITFVGSGGNEVVPLEGVDDGWHNLSHHGKDPEKIDMLAIIEREEFVLFAEFIGKMKAFQEGRHSLLDQTAVVLGSSLGNASSHNNSNLPIVLAGGGFKHGHHLAFPEKDAPPLSNLFISCLQHMGLEAESFSSGNGKLVGI
jgi:hypothetical protein